MEKHKYFIVFYDSNIHPGFKPFHFNENEVRYLFYFCDNEECDKLEFVTSKM